MTPRNAFIKTLSSAWKNSSPTFKSVHDPVFGGSTFLCSEAPYGRYYFLMVDFRHGGAQFTISVGISRLPDINSLQMSLESTPSSNSIGIFAIWQFMGLQSYHWQLSNIKRRFTPEDKNEIWKPTTYEQPVGKVVMEAVNSVNSSLLRYVFPVLKLEVQFPDILGNNGVPAK